MSALFVRPLWIIEGRLERPITVEDCMACGTLGTLPAKVAAEAFRAVAQRYGREFFQINFSTTFYGLLADSYAHDRIKFAIASKLGLTENQKLKGLGVDLLAGTTIAVCYRLKLALWARQLPSWKDLGKMACYGTTVRVMANLLTILLNLSKTVEKKLGGEKKLPHVPSAGYEAETLGESDTEETEEIATSERTKEREKPASKHQTQTRDSRNYQRTVSREKTEDSDND